MGREKTILLGFLGLLAGVFVGVLSLKLLVARPPTGTGPDIRAEVAFTTAQERVAPPAPGGWDFAAAPPLVPDAPDTPEIADEPPRSSRFAATDAGVAAEPEEPHDAISPVAWERTTAAADPPVDAVAEPVPDRFAPVAADDRSAPADPGPPVRDPFVTPAAATAAPLAGDYVVRNGDSWWDLAERAYGDGRLYRALFAWNRAREPRITLAPGTRLDVPPLDRLRDAWPRLAPTAGTR